MPCTTNFKDLLKGKHMLVEELLELLVDVVNADLFKAVVVKDLKAGDVEDTDVGDLLHGGVAQGLVTLVHLYDFFLKFQLNEENVFKKVI